MAGARRGKRGKGKKAAIAGWWAVAGARKKMNIENREEEDEQ
jgi:hypothetical protein